MTRNLRTQLATDAERWIRACARPDVSREDAAVMVTYWHLYEPTDPELVDEVLARFAPAEPPSVPGKDFAPVPEGYCWCGNKLVNDACPRYGCPPFDITTGKPFEADAAVLVAEAVADLDVPKPMADYFQKYLTVACPACKAAVGELCKDRDTAQWSHINRRDLSATQPPVPKRPPWSAFGPCPHCGVAAGKQCLFTRAAGSAQVGDLRQIAHNARPLLSEVQP